MPHNQMHKRRWRDYHTASGARPVKAFIDHLSEQDAVAVAAAMKEVEVDGLIATRHLRGDIFEVRADGDTQTFRILFATEGRYHHILLALNGFPKKTQKTPHNEIELAEYRLADWRSRSK